MSKYMFDNNNVHRENFKKYNLPKNKYDRSVYYKKNFETKHKEELERFKIILREYDVSRAKLPGR